MIQSTEIIMSRAKSPFSLKNRITRVFWSLIENSLFRYSPRICFRWRAFLLRSFGAKIGSGTHIYPKVKTWAPWNIIIGDDTGIADGVTLYSQNLITIGSRCVLSQNSYICTGTHDYSLPTYPLITKPIIINDDSWVAAGVFIHPGIVIGAGVIIGAHSVVTKSLDNWAVYAGNPCKEIRKRTSD